MTEFKFLELFDEHIKREGAHELKEWLRKSDFFEAPASTKYHSCHEGGLVEHSLYVYDRLKLLVEHCWPNEDPPTDETIAIVALLHDVCKANFYTIDYRNRKNEYGVWERVPYYAVDDKMPLGHGEKSVIILQSFMKLTREEVFAIRFHMGDYTDMNTGKAFRMFPLALLLHQADEQAANFDEEIG